MLPSREAVSGGGIRQGPDDRTDRPAPSVFGGLYSCIQSTPYLSDVDGELSPVRRGPITSR